jgi:predicted  nucleic acid-binding Zn-ribbon protein
MSTLLALATLALSAVVIVRLRKRERTLTAEVAALGERVRDLTERVEAAQADVAHAVTQSGITESLLVEKGIADEEEIEALRRRFDEDDRDPPPYEPERDGGLH